MIEAVTTWPAMRKRMFLRSSWRRSSTRRELRAIKAILDTFEEITVRGEKAVSSCRASASRTTRDCCAAASMLGNIRRQARKRRRLADRCGLLGRPMDVAAELWPDDQPVAWVRKLVMRVEEVFQHPPPAVRVAS